MKLLLIPISLLCVVLGPVVLWNAESQARAKDFASAREVSATSDEAGYIYVSGEAEAEGELMCPAEEGFGSEADTNDTEAIDYCIYVSETEREYQRKEREACSESRPQNTVRSLDKQQCDSNGQNCKPCYLVEEKEWVVVDSGSDYSEFTVGDYKVEPGDKANIVGGDELVVFLPGSSRENASSADPQVGDREVTYQYIRAGEEVLVAGEARSGEIYGDDKEFVISTHSYGRTLEELEQQDSSAKWGLRIFSLLLVIGGFTMLLSALASLPGFFLERIPVIGDKLEDKLSSIAFGLGGCLGTIAWLLFFATVMVLKNILALVIGLGLIVLIIIGVAVLMRRGGKDQLKAATASKS